MVAGLLGELGGYIWYTSMGVGEQKRWPPPQPQNHGFMQKDKRRHPRDPNQGHHPIHLHPPVNV